MTGKAELIPVTIASAFSFGMVLALLGSIKLPLAKRLDINETRVGGLLSMLTLALIPLMLLSGILIDTMPVRWVLVTGSLVLAVAVGLMAFSRNYGECLLAILLIGASGACLSTGSVRLMPEAFFPEHEAASFNLGNVFFGLGALITPTLLNLLMRGLGFRRALGIFALLCLAPALAGLLTPQFPQAPPPGNLSQVVREPALWLTALVFFLYCPLEGALGTWATTYLTSLGYREARAVLLLSGFWLTFLVGRLLAAVLERGILPPGSEPWVICVLALAAAVVLGNLAGAPRQGNAGWGLLLVGFLLGPIFPTLLGILFAHKQFDANRGTAYGAMFALGVTGNLVFPPLIGAYARRTTVQRALRIPLVIALLLAAVSLFVALAPWE
jgi:FHS family glucose/mannose:H+ symporter-like MFS transporter